MAQASTQFPAELSEVVTWHAHVDVWAVVAVLAIGYAYALRRIGPHLTSGPVASNFQQVAWYSGVALLWLVSGYPLHDIGEQALFSVHMVEHIVLTLVVPPLLLMGMPRWMARGLFGGVLLRPLRALCRPLVALILFNGFLAFMHWPTVINLMVSSSIAHFVVHTTLFATAIIMWMPVLSPLPEIPRAKPFVQMGYLFAQSLVPTVPASFLTFGTSPLYEAYDTAARLWGIDAVTDQAIAGLIMKLAGGAILWAAITIIWFRWYRNEQEWDRLERGLRVS